MNNCTSKNRLQNYFPSQLGDVDALVSQFFGPGLKSIGRTYFVPASVWEEDDSYHVQLDVPGVAKEDVEITFDKGKLTIAVERSTPEERPNRLHEERTFGKAVREIALSTQVDPESISAELSDGVLHVTVTKTPEAQPRRIEVS